MFKIVNEWYKQYFSDKEAVILIFIIGVSLFIVLTLGKYLAPVLTALVLAYLLQGLINVLQKRGLPRKLAFSVAYLLFLGLLGAFLFVLVPLTVSQFYRFVDEQLPQVIREGNNLLQLLPQQYPGFVSDAKVAEWSQMISSYLGQAVETVAVFSLTSVPFLVAFLIFVVLVPVLVFFFLKDKDLMNNWVLNALPDERPFIDAVRYEMNEQISNYVRGKAIEILIVGVATYIGLLVFGVKYSALLGLLVGLSVVIPYIGATIVTIPVTLVAYFQFGMSVDFVWVMSVYFIIQAIDGNVLVPWLFSEAVNLHPVAIIIAVLVFGGLWGVWGVFFAIPLATLIKATVTSWPHEEPLSNRADWLENSE